MPSPQSASVEARTAELKRELGLRDLVLTHIIVIVGGTWIGTAAKLGSAHVTYWLLASLLFFVPLSAVTVFLCRWKPLEGGLYQWAKLGLGEGFGFLVAWNLWVWAIVLMSSLGLDLATLTSYTFRVPWLAKSHAVIGALTVAILLAIAALTAFGLSIGKWVHNAGGAIRLGCYGMLVLLPLLHFLAGDHLAHYRASLAPPPATLLSVNILAKMGFGAFSGIEYVAIFAGESFDPGRSLRRSVLIAAPIVVLMFVLGTMSVTAFVPVDRLDLIAPLPQALAAGAFATGPTRYLAPIAAVVTMASLLSWGSATFGGIARLPMVAGWDGLLPAWFTRLHPRYRTPTDSILVVALATIALGLAATASVGEQEAYQLISSASLISYALTYLAMFAIPFVGPRRGLPRASVMLRVAAASGFAMTLLFIVLAVFPIVHVESTAAFTMKVACVAVGANLVGLALYRVERRRRVMRQAGGQPVR